MLHYSDIEAGIPVAQELLDRNVVLETKVGPLGSLSAELSVAIASCASIQAMQGEDYKSVIPDIVDILTSTSTSVGATEHGALFSDAAHDVKVEDFSDLITQGVLATVAKARTVCIPLIQRLENSIGVGMEKYEDRCVANITIDEIGVDGVLDNEEVFNYFSDYKDIRKIEIPRPSAFPALTDIQLAALVEAGSPEINEVLTEQLSRTASTGSLGQLVYCYLYTGDRLTNEPVELFDLRNQIATMFGDCCVLEGLMLGYYFGKGLLLNLPEGVNGSMPEIERRVGLVTSLLGFMIYGVLQKYRTQSEEKVLLPVGLPYVDRVTGEIASNVAIRVNREVYAGFLADGGSPEVLFGSMVSDHQTSMATLLANQDKYKAAYARFVTLNRSYTTASRTSIYVDSIRNEFYKAFDDMEGLKEIDKTDGVFTRMLNQLKRLGADHIASPEATYVFLRTLVCTSLYPDRPDIEKVISDIDNFEPRDGEENLSTSEIACFVLIDLIVDWLCDQVSVRAIS